MIACNLPIAENCNLEVWGRMNYFVWSPKMEIYMIIYKIFLKKLFGFDLNDWLVIRFCYWYALFFTRCMKYAGTFVHEKSPDLNQCIIVFNSMLGLLMLVISLVNFLKRLHFYRAFTDAFKDNITFLICMLIPRTVTFVIGYTTLIAGRNRNKAQCFSCTNLWIEISPEDQLF